MTYETIVAKGEIAEYELYESGSSGATIHIFYPSYHSSLIQKHY